jgi:hypothetical protein
MNLRICCIWLVDSVKSIMMHGLANPKNIQTKFTWFSSALLGNPNSEPTASFHFFLTLKNQKFFSLLQNLQTNFGAHPAPYSMDTIRLPRGKSAGAFWTLTSTQRKGKERVELQLYSPVRLHGPEKDSCTFPSFSTDSVATKAQRKRLYRTCCVPLTDVHSSPLQKDTPRSNVPVPHDRLWPTLAEPVWRLQTHLVEAGTGKAKQSKLHIIHHKSHSFLCTYV